MKTLLTSVQKKLTLSTPEEIKSYLEARGILYEQWQANATFGSDASEEEILKAYDHKLSKFMQENGFETADVINVDKTTPEIEAIRGKFLKEHTHSEDEVRFFVEGGGVFWFHLDDGEVLKLDLFAGDFISVPKNFKHWFDLAPLYHVKAIRVFQDKSGWVPHYTGSGVEERFSL